MRRFFYNYLARPLAWAIPMGLIIALLGLPLFKFWVALWSAILLDVLVNFLFPAWKATPKGNENARR
ncbi:hypothetical protein CWO91_16725 [Bradyrhizobium genosp. SA-3]|uniref:hypothetical protein n=1 Tax=Bradyrhizobium genosp. SA-3 TaxID=508868 RepID=UPI00102A1D57|nr:hypothetical protein [Bradyrhizobium genosp. SA-3]RZN09672.1 hypothetical protein CWO91_16725 [Bradyrhizobium genosp. SA-3]